MLSFKGWWEYYFLRYFVGTVVGAAVIFTIPACRAALECLIPGGAEWKYLAVLPALGFAYCYVASAPMLTLHVVRAYLFAPPPPTEHTVWQSRPDLMLSVLCCIAGLAAVVLVVLAIYCRCLILHLLHNLRGTLGGLTGLVVLSSVVIAQIISMVLAYRDKFSRITAFYWKVSGARAATEVPSQVGEYIESYRHMREHSNAYAILVFELLAAPVLAAASESRLLVPISIVWLLPPARCWLTATALEAGLTHHK